MHRATYFSDVIEFQSVHAATLLVFGYPYCIYQAAPCQLQERRVRSNITRGVATGRWRHLTYGYVAQWWSRLLLTLLSTLAPLPTLVDSDVPGPAICKCVLPLLQGVPMFKTLNCALTHRAIPCLLILLPMRHYYPLGVLRGRLVSSGPQGSNGSAEATWAFLCIQSRSILNISVARARESGHLAVA